MDLIIIPIRRMHYWLVVIYLFKPLITVEHFEYQASTLSATPEFGMQSSEAIFLHARNRVESIYKLNDQDSTPHVLKQMP